MDDVTPAFAYNIHREAIALLLQRVHIFDGIMSSRFYNCYKHIADILTFKLLFLNIQNSHDLRE